MIWTRSSAPPSPRQLQAMQARMHRLQQTWRPLLPVWAIPTLSKTLISLATSVQHHSLLAKAQLHLLVKCSISKLPWIPLTFLGRGLLCQHLWQLLVRKLAQMMDCLVTFKAIKVRHFHQEACC